MRLHLDVFVIILSAAYLVQQTDTHSNVCRRRKITNVKNVGHKGYENIMDIAMEEREARICAEEQLKNCKEIQEIHGCSTMLISEKHQRHFTVTASTTHSGCAKKNDYRLDSSLSWCAAKNDDKQYVLVTFKKLQLFRGVVTQNRGGNTNQQQRVTQYQIYYSTDCAKFQTDGKTYSGNVDAPSTVIRMFDTPVKGKCIRIHPTKWVSHVSMRFDIIGCEV